jgi:hypothetical protein
MTTCTRQAWLDLYGDGTVTIQLQNEALGYFCSSLDLGYPSPREVTSNNPDRNGISDRTRLLGGRVVTANITALVGAGARIDDVADNFAPFMVPAARPILHYILDRPGAVERIMTLRASGYSWPIAGPYQRDIQLQWMAADPVAYDPVLRTAIAWSGSTTPPGRTYNLTFPRTYPAGSGAAMTAILNNAGDLTAWPLIRIYGPITAPRLNLQYQPNGISYTLGFNTSFVLSTNEWVDIDCAAHTINKMSDPNQSVISSVNWVTSSRWPSLPPLPTSILLSLYGTSTTTSSQAVVTWHDGYLT